MSKREDADAGVNECPICGKYPQVRSGQVPPCSEWLRLGTKREEQMKEDE